MSRSSVFSWLRSLGNRPATWPKLGSRFAPRLELLESRALPSTVTVTSAADSGLGSLRAAIFAAHAGDHINFANSVHNIILASELDVTKSLDIDGPGADKLTISGHDVSRVFDIKGGVTASIEKLTVTHGLADRGAAILNEVGATLTIDHCTLFDNEAQGGAGGGGIVNEVGAKLTVIHSLLSDNQAVTTSGHDVFGGGLLNMGSAKIIDCRFEGNQAVGGGASGTVFSGSYGGAITNYGGPDAQHPTGATLTVANSTFTGNQAICAAGFFGSAGAIENDFGATATIANSMFANNVATGGPGSTQNGGALDNLSATMSVTNCLLIGNRSVGGSGGDGVSTFDQGIAGGIMNIGGDPFGIPNTSLTVTNSTFAYNLAIGGDGGTEPGPATNIFPVGLGSGGAIGSFAPGAQLNVVNSTFIGNQAIGGDNAYGKGGFGNGGGIANDVQSNAVISHCTFIGDNALGGNSGSGAPGGDGVGGGLLDSSSSTATVSDSTFVGNQAFGGEGGAGAKGGFGEGGAIGVGYAITFNLPDTSSLTLDHCSLSGNLARGGNGGTSGVGGDGDGGGVAVLSGTAVFKNSDITANGALGGSGSAGSGHGYGGGLYVNTPFANVDLTDHTKVRKNFATTDGDDVF